MFFSKQNVKGMQQQNSHQSNTLNGMQQQNSVQSNTLKGMRAARKLFKATH